MLPGAPFPFFFFDFGCFPFIVHSGDLFAFPVCKMCFLFFDSFSLAREILSIIKPRSSFCLFLGLPIPAVSEAAFSAFEKALAVLLSVASLSPKMIAI